MAESDNGSIYSSPQCGANGQRSMQNSRSNLVPAAWTVWKLNSRQWSGVLGLNVTFSSKHRRTGQLFNREHLAKESGFATRGTSPTSLASFVTGGRLPKGPASRPGALRQKKSGFGTGVHRQKVWLGDRGHLAKMSDFDRDLASRPPLQKGYLAKNTSSFRLKVDIADKYSSPYRAKSKTVACDDNVLSMYDTREAVYNQVSHRSDHQHRPDTFRNSITVLSPTGLDGSASVETYQAAHFFRSAGAPGRHATLFGKVGGTTSLFGKVPPVAKRAPIRSAPGSKASPPSRPDFLAKCPPQNQTSWRSARGGKAKQSSFSSLPPSTSRRC
ncbi:hypothetical protein PGT21_015150 [Puccinia graminis f. sp. tritici]|uniref:Uncharacterized protein n=1 Tax=Puccinia graminis f. sp. tritici TaxID=56615 RepID=A0A5B0S1L5_PUCGR|nr:hypothetical protein PGT21_015150 [Puccinia graminis f. sp. tritici]KAA1130554.1 hypothetical protein PGTUg99_021288 [Puccinia graminis f. sp. tritici]